jgi:hypothetical protein
MSEAFYGTPQATIIPPGVPGRIEPSPGDARPAPARARTLVGGRPLTLDLTTYTDFPESMRVAELIRQALGRVGITVTIRTDANPISVAGDPRQGIDLVLVGWATDFPDPASSLVDLLQWTDAEVWKRPEKAPAPSWLRPALAARAVTGPVRARTFSALDRRISRVDVPVAVYQASLGRPVFFAERVGCRRFLPLWYGLPDLARLCLRGKS